MAASNPMRVELGSEAPHLSRFPTFAGVALWLQPQESTPCVPSNGAGARNSPSLRRPRPFPSYGSRIAATFSCSLWRMSTAQGLPLVEFDLRHVEPYREVANDRPDGRRRRAGFTSCVQSARGRRSARGSPSVRRTQRRTAPLTCRLRLSSRASMNMSVPQRR